MSLPRIFELLEFQNEPEKATALLSAQMHEFADPILKVVNSHNGLDRAVDVVALEVMVHALKELLTPEQKALHTMLLDMTGCIASVKKEGSEA